MNHIKKKMILNYKDMIKSRNSLVTDQRKVDKRKDINDCLYIMLISIVYSFIFSHFIHYEKDFKRKMSN